MWNSIRAVIIFAWISSAGDTQVDAIRCIQYYEEINWESIGEESSRPVDNVEQYLPPDPGTKLNFAVRNARENLKLILLAIPRKNDDSDCPSNLTGHEDLRRHDCVWDILAGTSYFNAGYRYISTGCYYFAMLNNMGKYWIDGPKFYRTSYRYYDTKLNVTIHPTVKPENLEQPKEVKTEVRVPLPCIRVVARLFELSGHFDSARNRTMINEILNEKLRQTQRCVITNIGKNLSDSYCAESKLNTNLTLEVKIIEVNGGEWTATTKWKNLLRGGNTYFLKFDRMLSECDMMNGTFNLYQELRAWRPVGNSTHFNLGYVAARNDRVPDVSGNDFDWHPVVYSLVGLMVLVILIYWIRKGCVLVSRKKPQEISPSDKPERIVPSFVEKESNNVLFMYAKGSSMFMTSMTILRDRLAQACNCRVHDLYATSDWNMINKLGATGWVERLLIDGSKVVWVDTPQFRSLFNDKGTLNIAADFRDEAVSYAVSVAINLFQNTATQYRRHFVVRVEGFEVTDDVDDPLLTISPHARYFIPKHIPLLCEHLKGPPERLEDAVNSG